MCLLINWQFSFTCFLLYWVSPECIITQSCTWSNDWQPSVFDILLADHKSSMSHCSTGGTGTVYINHCHLTNLLLVSWFNLQHLAFTCLWVPKDHRPTCTVYCIVNSALFLNALQVICGNYRCTNCLSEYWNLRYLL